MPTGMVDCSGVANMWIRDAYTTTELINEDLVTDSVPEPDEVNAGQVEMYHGVQVRRRGTLTDERNLPWPPQQDVEHGDVYNIEATGRDWIYITDHWEECSDLYTHAFRREHLNGHEAIELVAPWTADNVISGDLIADSADLNVCIPGPEYSYIPQPAHEFPDTVTTTYTVPRPWDDIIHATVAPTPVYDWTPDVTDRRVLFSERIREADRQREADKSSETDTTPEAFGNIFEVGA